MTAPRVSNATHLKGTLEEPETHPNGTEIMKSFNGNKTCQGTVTTCDDETDRHRTDYEDGDWEEMSRNQVTKCKCLDMEKDTVKRVT